MMIVLIYILVRRLEKNTTQLARDDGPEIRNLVLRNSVITIENLHNLLENYVSNVTLKDFNYSIALINKKIVYELCRYISSQQQNICHKIIKKTCRS